MCCKKQGGSMRVLKSALIIGLGLSSLSAWGGADTSLQALLTHFSTFQANFVEIEQLQGQSQRVTGEVSIKRPDCFRWQTNPPNAELFVANGQKLYQYEPDLQQV